MPTNEDESLRLDKLKEKCAIMAGLLAICVFVAFACLMVMHARAVQRRSIVNDSEKVTHAIEEAKKWILNGQVNDSERIEEQLLRASISSEATERSQELQEAIKSFAQAKDNRQQALQKLDYTRRAITDLRFDDAHAYLQECTEIGTKYEQEQARTLLRQLPLVESDSTASSVLETMSDAELATLRQNRILPHSEYFDPLIIQVRSSILLKYVTQVINQRAEYRNQILEKRKSIWRECSHVLEEYRYSSAKYRSYLRRFLNINSMMTKISPDELNTLLSEQISLGKQMSLLEYNEISPILARYGLDCVEAWEILDSEARNNHW